MCKGSYWLRRADNAEAPEELPERMLEPGGLGRPPPALILVADTALPTGSKPGGIGMGIPLLDEEDAAAAPADF